MTFNLNLMGHNRMHNFLDLVSSAILRCTRRRRGVFRQMNERQTGTCHASTSCKILRWKTKRRQDIESFGHIEKTDIMPISCMRPQNFARWICVPAFYMSFLWLFNDFSYTQTSQRTHYPIKLCVRAALDSDHQCICRVASHKKTHSPWTAQREI